MNDDLLRLTEKFFHEQIPLTRVMGVRVVGDDQHAFAIEAPVGPNHNHLHTAFGGSINAIATLAGYGFLWLQLRDEAHVVIASSSIRFLRPVRETIRAVCQEPTASELERFQATLSEKGKSRIALKVTVEEKGERAAEFEGIFFALVN
ncbi:MAG: YiiD C-terminal domain-containing protein [Chthoniobacterales bacterium]